MKDTTKLLDVIGIGVCAVDYLGIVSEFPRPDTKNKMKQFSTQGGGLVATALVALSRLGASVSYYGKLGNDELSLFALDAFKKEGVDTTHVIREEGARPFFAFVIADEKTGQRTIWWSDEKVSRLKREELDKTFLGSTKFLLLDCYQLETALESARFAKEVNVKVVLDAERPDTPGIDKLLNIIDVLIVPEEFASGFTGSSELDFSAGELLKLGPSVVVITQGKEGSFCKTVDASFHKPAFQVKVVDTTGCGDVYHGAFIYGMLQEWPLEIVTEFSNAVAGLNARCLGGRAAAPGLEEAKNFLMKKGSPDIKEFLKTH